MRILMTGATGLIGNQLGIALVKDGHQVTVLSRRGNASDLCFPAKCLAWDHVHPLPESVLLPQSESFDAVIHLAGEPVSQRWNNSVKQKIRDSRIKSTKALVASFSRKAQLPRIWINASAIGYYGDAGQNPVDESTPAGHDFLPKICADWEQSVETLPDTVRRVFLRFGVVFSNEGGALPKMMLPFIYGLGGKIGSGDSFLSWIHIEDSIAAILYALKNESISGPMNVVAPTPVSNKILTTELSKQLGMPAVFPVPKFILRCVLGEMSSIILSSAKVLPKSLIDSGFKFKFPDITSALQDLLGYCRPRGTRLFITRQWIHGTPEMHFPFFSAAENLETITPPWLNFKIIGKSTKEIREGTLIDYKLKIKGVPVRWRTRIENWDPPRRFVDTQLRGPYRTWHHTHLFEPLGDGTLMTDRVLYRMWFWPFGDFGLPMVKNDVRTIFGYRKHIIEKLLTPKK